MSTMVVFESLWGNTRALAEAVAEGLGPAVTLLDVGRAPVPLPHEVDLLVVGGPTHGHGMSRPSTRETAASDKNNNYATPTVDPGLREWIDDLPGGEGRPAAAFDTRIDKPVLLTGSAAKGIARRLARRGFRVVEEPESFLVTTQNRLLEGQIDRAIQWGTALASRCLTLTS